jgi:hypothetical protein
LVTCWALIEEEAKGPEFRICKSIGMDLLTDNWFGLWAKDGSVALRETKPSISQYNCDVVLPFLCRTTVLKTIIFVKILQMLSRKSFRYDNYRVVNDETCCLHKSQYNWTLKNHNFKALTKNSEIAKKKREMFKTCWALMEEEAKGTDFLVRKFIVIPGIEFLVENLLGLWVIGGIVALRETKPSIIFFSCLLNFRLVKTLTVWFWRESVG